MLNSCFLTTDWLIESPTENKIPEVAAALNIFMTSKYVQLFNLLCQRIKMSLANSLAYLEDYLDIFEALPLEVTKQLSLMREMDGKCCELLAKTFAQTPEFLLKQGEMSAKDRRKELLKLQNQFLDNFDLVI